jgi:hypothetical protein
VDPERLQFRTSWIRPEDMRSYDSLGIDGFLLLAKYFSQERLTTLIKAYSDGRYDGDPAVLLSRECAGTVHPGIYPVRESSGFKSAVIPLNADGGLLPP